jgi:hypothetical protein
MRQKLSWLLLLWTTFIILILQDWHNCKYMFRLFREFYKILKKNSHYAEDSDFILIHKNFLQYRKKL